jgi:hypothetical protein
MTYERFQPRKSLRARVSIHSRSTSGKTSSGNLPPIWENFLHTFQRGPIGGNQGKYAPSSLISNISSLVLLTFI